MLPQRAGLDLLLQVGFDRDMKGLEAFGGATKGHSSILLVAQVSELSLCVPSKVVQVWSMQGCMYVRENGHQTSLAVPTAWSRT